MTTQTEAPAFDFSFANIQKYDTFPGRCISVEYEIPEPGEMVEPKDGGQPFAKQPQAVIKIARLDIESERTFYIGLPKGKLKLNSKAGRLSESCATVLKKQFADMKELEGVVAQWAVKPFKAGRAEFEALVVEAAEPVMDEGLPGAAVNANPVADAGAQLAAALNGVQADDSAAIQAAVSSSGHPKAGLFLTKARKGVLVEELVEAGSITIEDGTIRVAS